MINNVSLMIQPEYTAKSNKRNISFGKRYFVAEPYSQTADEIIMQIKTALLARPEIQKLLGKPNGEKTLSNKLSMHLTTLIIKGKPMDGVFVTTNRDARKMASKRSPRSITDRIERLLDKNNTIFFGINEKTRHIGVGAFIDTLFKDFGQKFGI